MQVDTERFTRLDDLMAEMEKTDARYRYSVAWLDCVRQRRGDERSILTRGDHASSGVLPDAPGGPAACEIPGDPTAPGAAVAPRVAGEPPCRSVPSTRPGSAPPRVRSGRSSPWPPSSTRSTPWAAGTCSTARWVRAVPVRRAPRPGRRRRGCRATPSPARASPRSSPCSSASARARRVRCPSPRRDGPWPSTSRSAPPGCPHLLDRLDELVADGRGPRLSGQGRPAAPGAAARHVPPARRDGGGVPAGRPRGRPGVGPVPAAGDRTMNDAFGHPQSIVVLGGTSDIARAHRGTDWPPTAAARRCSPDATVAARGRGRRTAPVGVPGRHRGLRCRGDRRRRRRSPMLRRRRRAGRPRDRGRRRAGDTRKPTRPTRTGWPHDDGQLHLARRGMTAVASDCARTGPRPHRRAVLRRRLSGSGAPTTSTGRPRRASTPSPWAWARRCAARACSVHVVRPGFVHTKMTDGPARRAFRGGTRPGGCRHRARPRTRPDGDLVAGRPALGVLGLPLLPQAVWRRLPG